MGQSLKNLPPADRAKRYRQFAAAALEEANLMQDEDLRASLLTIATGWHLMASELEDELIHNSRKPTSPTHDTNARDLSRKMRT